MTALEHALRLVLALPLFSVDGLLCRGGRPEMSLALRWNKLRATHLR